MSNTTGCCGRAWQLSVRLFILFVVILGSATSEAGPEIKKGAAKSVDRLLAVLLIRDAISAINHGNWTGNYTVLRDISAPNFSAANDATRLAAIFEPIRREGLDLSPVLVVDPVLEENVITQPGNRLKLKGYFPSLPRYIKFSALFEPVEGRWRLFGIGVSSLNPAAHPSNQDPDLPLLSEKDRIQQREQAKLSKFDIVSNLGQIPTPRFRPSVSIAKPSN